MSKNVLVVGFAFISTIALFSLNHAAQQSPEPKLATVPANEFSAERAHNLLQTLLAENKPHPVGSPQNKIVKSRITAELDRLSIGWEEQGTWACAYRYNGCAFVENIIAIIPGKSEDSFIALMAHYDSVPMAPGAGDDGAGVVAILESARALALEAPFEHSIMLLFTDAEEMGLIGAEGFFNQHPLAKKIKLVLDFEGSGTTGQSMVLRTTDANELLMNTLASQTASPFGVSFANEIFKRMPNDTDFSVVQRAGISGIDFAFAGERNHYHTPNDNTENLDLATIQHHGENMLPLARELASNKSLNLGEHV
ncbi:MAG: M20/M25/M40 family metallo-hydrolase, partial [Gammaproteobacteria bacterium]|nr:M20/M25/M40 family metallo-hydrolase [Gammaproteobacteria bacterium]